MLPLLVRNQNIVAAVKLCSIKHEHMKEFEQQQECFGQALEIIIAIVDSISLQGKSSFATGELGKLIKGYIVHTDAAKKDKLLGQCLKIVKEDVQLISYLWKFYCLESESPLNQQVFQLISELLTDDNLQSCVQDFLNGVSPLPKHSISNMLLVLRKHKLNSMLARLTVQVVTDDPKLLTQPRYSMEERLKLCSSAAHATNTQELGNELENCQKNLQA